MAAPRMAPRKQRRPQIRQAPPRAVEASPPGAAVTWLLLPALIAVALAAYHPAWYGGILWDDPAHLTTPALQPLSGLVRIWFEPGATQQYYPLTHSAFWLMHRLWGDSTLGYHIVNITLHGCSAFVLALLLRRLAIPGGILAAFIFALHPVHVESVAWMTELKNVLSGLLYLLAALAYLRFDETARRQWYAASIGSFVLALLAKTVTASLPAALLVVLWWRRGRISRLDLMRLAPFFTLGVLAGAGTAWVERTYVGAEGADFDLAALDRMLIAGRAVWFYASKLVWPVDLAFIYPRWEISQAPSWQYFAPLAALAGLWLLWRLRHRSRAPLAAALLFGGSLFPALGFIDVFPFRYSFVADHFQYHASIAPIVLFAAAATVALQRRFSSAAVAPVMTVVVGIPLAVLTWQQAGNYRDAETLYAATLAQNPDCWMCHNNLARIRLAAGDQPGALAHLDASLRSNPRGAEAHDNRGVVLRLLGRRGEALHAHEEAVRLAPGFATAHRNLGVELQAAGRAAEALAEFQTASSLNPGDSTAHDNAGTIFAAAGRFEEALQHFESALRIDPGNAAARNNRATALVAIRRVDEALAEYEEALRISPNDARTHDNYAFALWRAGRIDDALAHDQEALRLAPTYSPARVTMGSILLNSGRAAEAVPQFEAALQNPAGVDVPQVHGDLGVALARTGQRDRAIHHFREALRLRPGSPEVQANLDKAMAGKNAR
jgi:protein O-mannosyl-transferase